jgi:SAM-dependent methyltransferase
VTSAADLRLTALRRFSNATYAERTQQIVQRFATDFDATKDALLEGVGVQQPGARICELGFGTGWFLKELRNAHPACNVSGLELSPPMATHATRESGSRDRPAILIGDIEHIPVRRGAFDVVVVACTLYFMPDLDCALEEIKRVLRPGGKIVASTWAGDHLQELGELSTAALQHVFGDTSQRELVDRFGVDSAPDTLGHHFSRVSSREIRGWLDIPDVDTLVSLWEAQHSPAFPDVFIPVRDEFRRLAEERLARDGHLRITRHGAVFVGYNH